MEEDQRVFDFADHFFGVGDEIGRKVPAVELHALDHVELGVEALGLLDRDHAFLTDPVHGLGDLVADVAFTIGGDGAHLGDLGAGLDRLGPLFEVHYHRFDGFVDAALEIHRVHARGHRLDAFAHDGLGQNGRRGGAVAGLVVGPRCYLAQHLRAHVLEFVGKIDFLGNGHAVLGDARRAEGFIEHNVAALGAQSDLDRVGQGVDTVEHSVAGISGKFGRLSPCFGYSLIGDYVGMKEKYGTYSRIPMMSLSFMIRRSLPSTLTSVPDHLP